MLKRITGLWVLGEIDRDLTDLAEKRRVEIPPEPRLQFNTDENMS